MFVQVCIQTKIEDTKDKETRAPVCVCVKESERKGKCAC